MAVPPQTRKPDAKVRAARLAGGSLARYIGLVRRTSRLVTDPPGIVDWLNERHPLILACWHGQFMMLSEMRPKGVPVKAMVARHGDAAFIGEAMLALGVDLIRGAGAGSRKKDRGGAHALRAAVGALQDGASVVMTADVPPGPARVAGPGIIAIARLSGRPIVPIAAATSRFRALDTWSRMTINMPFSTLAFAAGEPIFVPRECDEAALERYRLEVERSLADATRRAYALAGADVSRITPLEATDPAAPPRAPGLTLKTYRHATSLFRAGAPMLLKFRERQGKEDPARRGERLGRAGLPRPPGRLSWIHAASVGETNAVLPLIEGLRAAHPDMTCLLTTGTLTSADIARRRLPPGALHQYVPLDTAPYARRFLDHWQPDLAVFTESEIWPNLILETAARGVPLALVNARMSKRSFKRWKRNTGTSLPLFQRFAVVLAQNDRLARSFSQLGARRVVNAGNLKIDAPPPPVDANAREALRKALDVRPLLLAASTHEGEEAIVAEAHRTIARDLEALCTILAPRHPDRGTAIAEQLKAQGFNVVQRSAGQLPDARTEIYIADTIGELGTLYSLCPLAFIGGSLIPHGGQNPIEAVRHGTGVMTGPHWHNFTDAYTALLRDKGAVEVKTAADIAATVLQMSRDASAFDRLRRGADAALGSLSGALDLTLAELARLLVKQEGGNAPS